MEFKEFIDRLYAAGWDSPCDAQHEKIVGVYNDACRQSAEIAYGLGIKAGIRQAEDIATALAAGTDVLQACRNLYANGDLVAGVKLYREAKGCGLKEAIDAVKVDTI